MKVLIIEDSWRYGMVAEVISYNEELGHLTVWWLSQALFLRTDEVIILGGNQK